MLTSFRPDGKRLAQVARIRPRSCGTRVRGRNLWSVCHGLQWSHGARSRACYSQSDNRWCKKTSTSINARPSL